MTSFWLCGKVWRRSAEKSRRLRVGKKNITSKTEDLPYYRMGGLTTTLCHCAHTVGQGGWVLSLIPAVSRTTCAIFARSRLYFSCYLIAPTTAGSTDFNAELQLSMCSHFQQTLSASMSIFCYVDSGWQRGWKQLMCSCFFVVICHCRYQPTHVHDVPRLHRGCAVQSIVPTVIYRCSIRSLHTFHPQMIINVTTSARFVSRNI